jgi:hypothetical protein
MSGNRHQRASSSVEVRPSVRPASGDASAGLFSAGKRCSAGKLLVATLAVLVALVAADAWGCPTCKDGVLSSDPSSANIARGYFYSILLMLAMPFTLAGCFGLYVWREYQRQQRSDGVPPQP